MNEVSSMINVAIIGAGKIAAVHAAAIRRSPNARLTWITNRTIEKATALAGPEVKVSTDAHEAITAPDVDAVIITTITGTHIEYILAAVEAGKAVLCEKPVDLDLPRAQACLRQVEEMSGRVQIGFNRRYDPTVLELHDRIDAGEIGNLEQLTLVSRDELPPPLEYVPLSGGIFKDMMIHELDLARFFLGPITSIHAVGQNVVDPRVKALGDFDAAVAVLKAESGAVATIINDRRCVYGWDQRIEAFGSLGSLTMNNQRATSVTSSHATSTNALGRVLTNNTDRYGLAFERQIEGFIASVSTGSDLTPSIRDGVEALELAEAATLQAHADLA
ncbi:MAG: Gfo/Idh/MocA family oxidoreductase [Ancrocorticia sp.]|uniref:Gfo/Idh/MocA family oxidoreductase n=1 Tax=Ancrocorticia sp. TaxID=2593684 RepID=UPI003F927FA0